MPASVQPEGDVEVEIQETDDLDNANGAETPPVEHFAKPQPDDEAAQATTEEPPVGDAELAAARFQRFCALAEKLVPNKNMWSTVYNPPTDFFTPDELPFQEKVLWSWRFWDTLMLPCITSMTALLASMFTLFTFMVSILLFSTEGDVSSIDQGVVMALTSGPLFFGVVAIPVVLENPARLVLYYRLWEQKVVVNFKQRGLVDGATRKKVALIVLTIGGYVLYGWSSEQVWEKEAFTFVVLQSFGAMGLSIYKTLPVEYWLQGINGAFRHYQSTAATKEEGGEASSDRYQDKAARAIQQVEFVPEWCVKYDIKVIQAYSNILSKKLREATALHTSAPSQSTAAAVAACQEEGQWLKILAMWIGRLGNTKEIFKSRWGPHKSYAYVLYATEFVSGACYDDPMWHAIGSFRCTANVTGPTSALRKFAQGSTFVIILIELYGLLAPLFSY